MSLKRLVLASLMLASSILAASCEAAIVCAQAEVWTEPTIISDTPGNAWFPDLAVDGLGNVHAVWCQGASRGEAVSYTRWDGHEWSTPNCIVAPQQDIRRSSIAAGLSGELFMVVGQTLAGRFALVFATAPAVEAWSAASWSSPRIVNARGYTYMADLETDHNGNLHLLFDDLGYGPVDDGTPSNSDVYYRRSTDGGRTWSVPINLSQSAEGGFREQLVVDQSDTLHVTWDEGFDRLSGRGAPHASVYRSSSDGGFSWSSPVTITYPTTDTVQLAAGADGEGGVMLVWRAASRDEVFYQWSPDYGGGWSRPGAIPAIVARVWDTPFDLYAMASDSAGRIHLLIAGRRTRETYAPVGLYHLTWDGHSWSSPVAVYSGIGYADYPRLVISDGNHLHAAWFVRDDLWTAGNYDVWYSHSFASAPRQTPITKPTPAPPATPPNAPTAVPTLYPTLRPGSGGLPSGAHTETTQVLRLAVALVPVLLLVLTVAVCGRLGRRRS